MIVQGGPQQESAGFEAQGYSGPLSLLLDLIEQRKVDICEVSLAQITDDYLKRISLLEWPDLEESSRFLVIAATLLFIKARVLMPKRADFEKGPDDEEGDPAELLVQRLREYKVFRDAAQKLRRLEAAASRCFRRARYEKLGAIWPGNPVEGLAPEDLYEIFNRIASANRVLGLVLPYEETPLEDLMNELIGLLRKRHATDFLKALGAVRDKRALLGSLLAMLELTKLGVISISQLGPGQPIWMSLREEGLNGPGQDESAD